MADEPTGAPEPGEGTAPTNAGRTYTDSDMAKLRQSERKRFDRQLEAAKANAPSLVAEELGFADADELRDFFMSAREKQPEIEKAQGELKRLQRENVKLAKALEERDAAYNTIRQEYHGGKVNDAITSAAVKAGAIDPKDFVLRLAGRFEFGEDGIVSADGVSVEEAVKALADENPRFLRPAGGTGANSEPANSTQAGPDLLTPEGRMAALAAAYGR